MTAISVCSLPRSEPIKIELPKVISQYYSPADLDVPNFETPQYIRNIYSLATATPPQYSPKKLTTDKDIHTLMTKNV